MTLRTKTTRYVLAWSVLTIAGWAGFAQDPPPPPPPPAGQEAPKGDIKGGDNTGSSKVRSGIGFIKDRSTTGVKRVAKGGKQVGKGATEGVKEVTGKGYKGPSTGTSKEAKVPEKPKE